MAIERRYDAGTYGAIRNWPGLVQDEEGRVWVISPSGTRTELPSSSTILDVTGFGAVGDGTTDDTTAIQDAIDSVSTTGGVVFFPKGTYAISSTLSVSTDSVILRGEGAESRINGGAFTGVGTRIKWNGAIDGGPIVEFAPDAAAANPLDGGGVEYMTLDGNQRPAIGLSILSSRRLCITNVHIHECKVASLDLGPISDVVAAALRNSNHHTFYSLSIFNFSADGSGIRLRGTLNFANGGENTYGCHFFGTYVRVTDGLAAIDIMDADDCFFYGTFIGTPGTASAVELREDDGVNQKSGARNCHFFGLYPNNGGIFSRSGADTDARNNSIWALSYEDGTEPEVTVESGSTLAYYDTRLGGKLNIATPVRESLLVRAQGLAGENFSRNFITAGGLTVSGTVYFMGVGLFAGDVITNIHCVITTIGASITACKVGLYDSASTRLALSADLGTSWQSTGQKTHALTAPYTVTADGMYYIALFNVAGTGASPGRQSASSGQTGAIGSGKMLTGTQTGQTDLPSPATIAQSVNFSFWVGWS